MVCDECGQRFVFVGPRVSRPGSPQRERVAAEHFAEKHGTFLYDLRTEYRIARRNIT